MNLRKQLIERSLSHKPNKTIQATHPPGTRSHDPAQLLPTDHDGIIIRTHDSVDGETSEGVQGDSAVMELRRKVRELEQRCQAERRQSELVQRDRESMRRELLQAQEQVCYGQYCCYVYVALSRKKLHTHSSYL